MLPLGIIQLIFIFAFLTIVSMFVGFGTMGNPGRGEEIMNSIMTWVFLIGFGPWLLYYGIKILKAIFVGIGAGGGDPDVNSGYVTPTGLKFDIEDAIEVFQKANHLNGLGALSNDALERIVDGIGRSEIARDRVTTASECMPPIRQLDPYYSISAIETVASSKLLKAGEAELARHVIMSRLDGKEPIEVPHEPESSLALSEMSSGGIKDVDEVEEYRGVVIEKRNMRWFIGDKKFLTLGKAKAYIKNHELLG